MKPGLFVALFALSLGTAFTTDALQPGDELVTINGRPVSEFPAGVEMGTELGRIFLARKPGDSVDLGIIRRRPDRITVPVRSNALPPIM